MRKDVLFVVAVTCLAFCQKVDAASLVLESGQAASYTFATDNTTDPNSDWWGFLTYARAGEQGSARAVGVTAGTLGDENCLVLQAPENSSTTSTPKTSWWSGGAQYGGGNVETSLDWTQFAYGTVSFDLYPELPLNSAGEKITAAEINIYKPAFILWSQHPDGFWASDTDSTLGMAGFRLYCDNATYDRAMNYDAWNHIEATFDSSRIPISVKVNGVETLDYYVDNIGSWSTIRNFSSDHMLTAFSNMDAWGIQYEFKGTVAVQPINLGIRNVQLTSGASPVPGDANGNGVVDETDAAALAANWLSSDGVTWKDGDFTGDGIVDDADAALMAANWGSASSASVPEPSVLALLTGGLLLLLWKRKAE